MGFKVFDLIVYGVIIVLIAVLFISIFATSDRSPLSGVRVCVDNRAVFEYDFEKDEYEILSDKIAVENGADKLTVTVTPHSGESNVIVINKKSGTVKITEANCHGKDCKYMPEIDYTKCTGCLTCVAKCPRHIIISRKVVAEETPEQSA